MATEDIIQLVQKLPFSDQRALANAILSHLEESESIERALLHAGQGEGTSHEDILRQLRAKIDAATSL